jgi:hypothetical protein
MLAFTMLRQASVHQLRTGAIKRESAHIAICMALHPRNLPGNLRDEYQSCLAPDRELFDDFKGQEKKIGHDKAFAAVNYEARFQMGADALEELKRLAKLSEEKVVYLVCQCSTGERCHRELLLLTAKELFGTKVGNIYHSYPIYQARLPEIRQAAKKE